MSRLLPCRASLASGVAWLGLARTCRSRSMPPLTRCLPGTGLSLRLLLQRLPQRVVSSLLHKGPQGLGEIVRDTSMPASQASGSREGRPRSTAGRVTRCAAPSVAPARPPRSCVLVPSLSGAAPARSAPRSWCSSSTTARGPGGSQLQGWAGRAWGWALTTEGQPAGGICRREAHAYAAVLPALQHEICMPPPPSQCASFLHVPRPRLAIALLCPLPDPRP